MARRDQQGRTGSAKAQSPREGKDERPSRGKARSSATRTKRVAASGGGDAELTETIREPAPQRGPHEETRASAPAASTPVAGWCRTPTGVRLSIDPLTVDAEQPQLEKGGLRASVSIHRGDELLYGERLNFDWPGGRDRFLRKAARALATAGVVNRPLTEALVQQMREALRTRSDAAPADPAAERARRAEGVAPPERIPARARRAPQTRV